MEQKYIVVDIETVPNTKLSDWQKSYINKKIENKRGDNKDPIRYSSLNSEFGEILCIGLYISNTDKYHILSDDEPKLLQRFWDCMKDNLGCKIVTFNGKRFDSVYIHKRSCINNINNYNLSIPNRRYDIIRHFDLLEILTNYYTDEYHSLSVFCKLYGIPVTDEHNGSDIYKLYKEGNLEEIYKHCLSDIKLTNQLYLKVRNYL